MDALKRGKQVLLGLQNEYGKNGLNVHPKKVVPLLWKSPFGDICS